MQIIWHGQFCFQFITQKGKNNLVNIVIDSPDEKTEFKASKIEADILLNTHNNIKEVKGSPFIINNPGEYEIKEVFVQGIESGINTIYIVEAEGVRVCYLGDLKQKELTDEQIENIGDVDILIISANEETKKIIAQIEPKIIIPIYLKKEKLDNFLKLMGVKKIEPLGKLSIKKKDILEGEAKVIVLKS